MHLEVGKGASTHSGSIRTEDYGDEGLQEDKKFKFKLTLNE